MFHVAYFISLSCQRVAYLRDLRLMIQQTLSAVPGQLLEPDAKAAVKHREQSSQV